ncbi:hypothetical protein [Kibdelosporangium phytohabitans]|nr:hypothetical protein [Kibdelosporangium phytohabitans]MBE1467752.1 hypothetical protein [Kibdelosporangium phytohabitans]
MIDDRTEARDLLGLMTADEPPVATDSATLVRKARNRQVMTRSAMVGGVAMGVVEVVFFASLARPGPAATTPAAAFQQPPTDHDIHTALPRGAIGLRQRDGAVHNPPCTWRTTSHGY